MKVICPGCGKTAEDSGFAFCPYCGGKLAVQARAGTTDRKAEIWVRKALSETAYPKRGEILRKGLEECPDSREILWELLFIGEEARDRRRIVDFSVIKCHILDFYLEPEKYTEAQQDEMRFQLFEAPELAHCLRLYEDPEGKRREYLQRLCREYISVFLEEDNRIMGNWFGFRNRRNREQKLAEPVSSMIRRIGTDEKLLPEQRELLRHEMVRAFAAETGGRTDLLQPGNTN